MKLNDKKYIIQSDGRSDKKSKLNKLNKLVNQKHLDKIEQGVTIEDLDKMKAEGLPILKYKTQITIHGIFPTLQNNIIGGYVNVFQNKNRSIGVRYTAIDEDKRKRIAESLKWLGFKYKKNSSDTCFQKVARTSSKEEAMQIINEYKELADKIDTSLFYGGKSVYYGSYMGMIYIFFDLHIGAIYESNIPKLLLSVGITSEFIAQKESEQKAKDLERKEYWAQKKREEEAKQKQSLEAKSDQLNRLKQLQPVNKHNDDGLYIRSKFNWKDELVFELVYIYTPKGKKKPRYRKEEFTSIDDALSANMEAGWNDSIYNGKFTGYKIK